MEIHVTRDSVAMGDDVDAPHEQRISFPDSMPIEEAIEKIADSNYLARVQGGATWSVTSGRPLAVIAQGWNKPRLVGWQAIDANNLQIKEGSVALHFNYHEQIDPDVVLKVLKRLKLHVF